jgi:hypothetical protein
MSMVHTTLFRGEHLVNFDADHTEIVGINPNPQLQSVFTLIEDNVIHQEYDQQHA